MAGSLKVSLTQLADDDAVERIDEFLSGLSGWVQVYGIIEDKRMALRVGGYRLPGQRPIFRAADPDRPDDGFERTHYSSMTFEFEREDEAREFFERFG